MAFLFLIGFKNPPLLSETKWFLSDANGTLLLISCIHLPCNFFLHIPYCREIIAILPSMRIAILFKFLETTAGLSQLLTFLKLFVLTRCQPPLKWFILPHKMYKRTLENIHRYLGLDLKISWNWEDDFIIYQVSVLHITLTFEYLQIWWLSELSGDI